MNKQEILLFSCALFLILLKPGFCADKFDGINPNQPIAPGGVIFYNEEMKKQNPFQWLDYAKYIYLGTENNNLRVKYLGRDDITQADESNDQIMVPFNDQKQASLSVNKASSNLPPVKLRVTLDDDGSSIRVQ